jgi:hypothetical protein
MTSLEGDLLASSGAMRSGAIGPAGKRVAVLYEPGRAGSAALDLARRLVGPAGTALTVVSVAPQDTRICCGAGSAMAYNRTVCETSEAELRQARELLGPVAELVSFKVLVEGKDPPFAAWVAAGGFDVVLLPARRRPLRSAKHPAAKQLRRSTSVEVCVVDAESRLEEQKAASLGAPVAGADRW